MNENGDEENPCCYFHPTEKIVGVCAFCLNEKLLMLASKQRHRRSISKDATRSSAYHNHSANGTDSTSNNHVLQHHHHHHHHQRKSSLTFVPKIFALGSFFHRLEFRQDKSDEFDTAAGDTSTSQEDSFISIKFEDNGVASWDKDTAKSKVCLEPLKMPTINSIHQSLKEEIISKRNNKSVVEHVKQQPVLRWRKRIGQLFQIVRRKRSSKANVCRVGSKAGGVKIRNGWIRSLTKRRTTE